MAYLRCNKCAVISQPMAGKSAREILEARKRATKELRRLGFAVLNSYYPNVEQSAGDCRHPSLRLLAKCLDVMANCEASYFCKGWENARGCRIEHEAAQNYGLAIIYEE